MARLCRELGVPCVAVVGSVADGADGALDEGLAGWIPNCDRPITLEEALRDAPILVERAAATLMRLIRAGQAMNRV